MANLQAHNRAKSAVNNNARNASNLQGFVPELPEASYALTDSQKEILAMLEDKPHAASEMAEASPGGSVSLDVVFATVGGASMVAGVTLVFFFAAAGAVLLVLGAILCAVAFEHVALRDVGEQEAALSAESSATLPHELP